MALNWAAMSKEQKQYVFLGAIGGAAALYALFAFVLKPALSTVGESKQELREMESQLRKADIMINNEQKIRTDLSETARELDAYDNQYIPPLSNPLTWATRTIYAYGRKLGVEIESVSPVYSGTPPWIKDKNMDRVFVPYAVQISSICGYFELAEFARIIEEDNPYACIKAITISKGGEDQTGDIEKHRVTFQVEWPMWRDKEAQQRIHHPPKRRGQTEGTPGV
jgi:Tfp pilus assembly protein PilO